MVKEKIVKKILLLAALCLGMSGCGGGSGSTETLETVYLNLSPVSDRLEADILDGNSCTTGGGTFITQTIPIDVTSTAYSNAINKSPVTINSISISYRKYDPTSTAPVLPTQYDTGKTIAPNSTVTFDVKVAPDKLKFDLVDKFGFNLCSADYWEYYATITFNGVEDYTGKSFSKFTEVKVAFADRDNL